jgi:hypothetical protein
MYQKNCCVAGYHFCTMNEAAYGGRFIETTGTGRTSDPYGQSAEVHGDRLTSGVSVDCDGWTSTAGTSNKRILTVNTSVNQATDSCDVAASSYQWCCSR